jgi:hypothetical protein
MTEVVAGMEGEVASLMAEVLKECVAKGVGVTLTSISAESLVGTASLQAASKKDINTITVIKKNCKFTRLNSNVTMIKPQL